jgi:hypothetical protein
MKQFDYIIYGNNIGAMIAAVELAKRYQVALINPARGWGGTLGGMKINGTNFDIGMNYFEFTSFHTPSDDLETYNPQLRNDSARFFHKIEKYVAAHCDFAEVDTPSCYVNDAFYPDFVMSNQLDFLSQLPDNQKDKIKNELEKILEKGIFPLHASQKKQNEQLFVESSFEAVSLANHGETFHALYIESLCKKILNCSSADLPALFHRVAWLPLFYPNTLLDALNGKNVAMPSTIFHYPTKGYFADFIEKINIQIVDNQNIELIFDNQFNIIKQANAYHFAFENATTIAANQLIWCADFPTLLTKANVSFEAQPFAKASIVLGFLAIDSDAVAQLFTSLYVLEKDCALYRLTNQDATAKTNNASSRFIFELNFDVCEAMGLHDEKAIVSHLQTFLQKSKIFKQSIDNEQFIIKIFKNAVNLPLQKNRIYYEYLQGIAKANFDNITYIGIGADFVATSFNDQIVQALKAALE